MEMSYTETLTVTHCWCGIAVAIPRALDSQLSNKKGFGVYCPLGHEFIRTETNEEKLIKAQRALRAERDLREAEERSHSATKGHLTRIRKRVEHGVCPHCNRSFQDLRRHMRSKHRKEITK